MWIFGAGVALDVVIVYAGHRLLAQTVEINTVKVGPRLQRKLGHTAHRCECQHDPHRAIPSLGAVHQHAPPALQVRDEEAQPEGHPLFQSRFISLAFLYRHL